ncbi:MAG TPA: VWA domain-containing protein [Acidimicrobiales bacterium]|nr:VWA domain-containing protein [Acidimicrobiales bacterium]
MTFLAGERLWLLLVLPVLAAVYALAQRRRRHQAVRFSNLALLQSLLPRRAAWRRHGPAVVTALALAGLVVGFARPATDVQVPKEAATIMLVIDTSASMEATDVAPSRLEAAVAAASEFVEQLPASLEVGLVSFDRQARVEAPPTTDHVAVLEAIEDLRLGPGTAAGDALAVAVDALEAAAEASGADPTAEDGGAAVVLLSDGVTTVGRPVAEAAQLAADAGIPVSTIAFGTSSGAVEVGGRVIAVPADPDTMAHVAEITSGTFFEAFSSEQLREVYEDIGTRVGFEIERREVSGRSLAGATVLLVAGLGLGLLWNGRLV